MTNKRQSQLYLDSVLRLLDPRSRQLEPEQGSVGCSLGQVKSFDAKARTMIGVVSTPNVDRYEEIVLPSAFKKRLDVFMANPVFCAGHVYSAPDGAPTVIGHWQDMKITDTGLEGKAKFLEPGDPLADSYFARYQQGAMRAFSVGWLTHEWEMREVKSVGGAGPKKIRHFTDVELIEVSAVAIPANRESLVRSAGLLLEAADHDQDALVKGLENLLETRIAPQLQSLIIQTLTDPLGPIESLIREVVAATLAHGGSCSHDDKDAASASGNRTDVDEQRRILLKELARLG